MCLLSALLLAGCRQDMHDPPRYRPLAASSFFSDGRSARPVPADTVARGNLRIDRAFYTAKDANGQLIDKLPFPLTREVVERGKQRFEIYCTPCHGESGDGEGMIVQRGFRHPPSYHIDRLRNAPLGHFYDVITNGFGQMISYAARVEPRDRWCIATYIRALQLSRNAKLADVPPDQQKELQ